MKSLIKLITTLGVGLGLSAVAQPAMTAPSFTPLLSGFNVLVQTNLVSNQGLAYGATLNTTNVMYTTVNGQIVLSYQQITNVSGSYSTNVAPDAFKIVQLYPDLNGDINANASVIVQYGNTNYLPIIATNAQGQYFTTNWALATSQYPNWMYPGTTNFYPLFNAATNTFTVTLYRAPTKFLNGSGGAGNESTLFPYTPMWETTSAFSFTVTQNGSCTNGCVITNLPAAWLQGAKYVYANINLPANMSTNLATGGVLINQLGILAPRP